MPSLDVISLGQSGRLGSVQIRCLCESNCDPLGDPVRAMGRMASLLEIVGSGFTAAEKNGRARSPTPCVCRRLAKCVRGFPHAFARRIQKLAPRLCARGHLRLQPSCYGNRPCVHDRAAMGRRLAHAACLAHHTGQATENAPHVAGYDRAGAHQSPAARAASGNKRMGGDNVATAAGPKSRLEKEPT